MLGRLPDGAEPRQLRLFWRKAQRLALVLAMPDAPSAPEWEGVLRITWRPLLQRALERFAADEPDAAFESKAGSETFAKVRLFDGTRIVAFDHGSGNATFVDEGGHGRALLYVNVSSPRFRRLSLAETVDVWERFVPYVEATFAEAAR